jgi:hypothetical protein
MRIGASGSTIEFMEEDEVIFSPLKFPKRVGDAIFE